MLEKLFRPSKIENEMPKRKAFPAPPDSEKKPSSAFSAGSIVLGSSVGRYSTAYDFLKVIFTSNFRDMGNLRPRVFGWIKMSFRLPKKGQLKFSERK